MPPSAAVDQSHTSAALALAAESSLTAGQVATTSVETDTAPKSKAVTIARMTLKTIFPPLSWLPVYEPSQQLLRDLAGGLVMGVMHVPMSLGYASLLNIPLQVGLWSAVIYSGIYAFFGNTGVLSMGPVAEISLMLLSTPGLSDDPAQRAAAIQTVSFEVGVLSLGLCLIMGGTLIRNSFARAVGNAYAAAAGIIVIPSQMKDALNIKGSSTVLLQDSIQVIINGLSNTNWTNTIICFCIFLLEIGYLSSIKRVKFLPVWIPHPLIVVVVSILVTWLARLDERINLHIVKDVNGDWPTAAAPDLSQFSNTIVTGVVVTLVSFLQMYSVATRFSDDVNANQELFANGMCGFLCGFLGGMPGSTSFSRTAVLVDMKSKSPLNSIVAAIVVLASAAGLTRLGVFYYLPKVTLAAVTVAGVTKLIDFTHAVWLFKHFKLDFLVWLVVFFMTMFMGVAYGILCGIGLSIVIVLFRVGLPSSSTLAYDPAMDRWVDVTQDDELLLHREVHVWSFNSPLYFVNVSYFAPELEESLRLEKRRIRVVVVNCVSITSIDASSVESFVFQVKNMSERKGLTVVFCALPKAVKEALQQCPGTGFEFQCFNTINEAVSFADRHVMKEKQLLAPHHPVPAAVFRGEGNAATSTDSTVAIVAVVSSADRSPKQKIKLPIRKTPLQRILDENGGAAAKIKMGSVTYVSIQQALRQWSRNDPVRRKEALALASVMDEQRDDLKIVVKKNDAGDLNLIAKWGGVITPIGLQQAEACGEALASRLGFHHLRHAVQQDTAIDESRGLTALVTDLWKNRHAPPAAKTVPVVSAVTNGEDRALHTGRALVDAFVRAAKGGALSTQQDSVELVPDKALDEVSKECAAFNDRSDALVENALHARNAKETGLVMHLPGVRRVVESVEPMVNDVAHAAPIVALQQVVQLTMSLVRAVRDASQIPLPDAMVLGPVADLLQNGNPLDASGASSGEDMEGGELTDVDQPARAPNGGLQRVLSGGSLKRHSSDGGLRSVGSGNNFASGAFEPTPNIRFADGESPADFIRRYTIVIAKLLRRAEQGGDVNGAVSGTDEDDEYSAQDSDLQLLMQGVDSTRFDVSKITALYDNATYDVIHNATQLETLCNFDLRPLVSLLQPLYVAVTSGRFGVTSSERLIGGALQSVPLLRRLRQNFEERVNAPSPVPDASEAAASGSGGDVLRERMVPVNMIFTSASLITALRNCMAFSTAMRKASNPGAQAALLQEETGWHYMAHVVFNLTASSDVAEAKPSSEQASTSSPTDQASPLVPMRPFDGYILDIFLSTGASLASDAAMELITEQERHGDVPVSPASPAFSTEGPSPFTSPPRDSAAAPVVVSGTTVGTSNPLAASGAASQAGKKTQLAARQLTRVSPMLRVWRLPLAHFFDVVDEMERVARTWSLGSS